MIVKIKYKNPDNLNEYIIEELDDELINVPTYCENLHKQKLCKDISCDWENCKIWIAINNNEFVLAGIYD